MFILFSYSFILILVLCEAQNKCQNDFGVNKLDGVCIQISDCLGGAFISKSCGSLVCCVPDKSSNTTHDTLTKEIFLKIAGNSLRNEWLYGHFCASLEIAQVSGDSFKLAAYLSQTIGETDYFKFIESKIAERDFDSSIGNNKTGDGTNYRGRGAILLRGKENYILASAYMNLNLLDEPEKAVLPSYAFKIGAWFWISNSYVIESSNISKKGSLNLLADGTFFNFTMLTHALTSNIQSLKFRANINDQILKELKSVNMIRGQGIECKFKESKPNEVGYAVPICLNDFKKPYCGCEGTYEDRSCPYGFNYLNKCRNSALVKCCIEKCTASLDLALLIDNSGSIGVDNYEIIRNFTASIVSNLPIGNEDTRVSLISYNSLPNVLFDFSYENSIENLLTVIKNMTFLKGGTRTDLALSKANDAVFSDTQGMRPIENGVPKVIIVITDGLSNEPNKTINEANKIKNRGINIISVGIKQADKNELLAIASTPNDVYYVSEFNKVLRIVQSLIKTTCQQQADINYAERKSEIQSRINENSYKYFKLNLFSENQEYLKEFTIQFQKLSGQLEFLYSFDYENPKSDGDYVKDNNPSEKDENFIDKLTNSSLKGSNYLYSRSQLILSSKRLKTEMNNKDSLPETVYYPFKNEDQKESIYFSVKGFSQNNEFKISVYDKYISNGVNSTTVILAVVLSLVALISIGIALFFSIKKFKRS